MVSSYDTHSLIRVIRNYYYDRGDMTFVSAIDRLP